MMEIIKYVSTMIKENCMLKKSLKYEEDLMSVENIIKKSHKNEEKPFEKYF